MPGWLKQRWLTRVMAEFFYFEKKRNWQKEEILI